MTPERQNTLAAWRAALVTAVFAAFSSACGGEAGDAESKAWSFAVRNDAAALLSVHGRAPDDVWTCGADDGSGPFVAHSSGSGFERLDTGLAGDLWWVHELSDGTTYFGGSNALLVRYDGAFDALAAPGSAQNTVFGIWASAPDDVYAVGSADAADGFVWHFDGERFRALALPEEITGDPEQGAPPLFKVWGTSADDVWVVGGRGLVLRGSASRGFSVVRAGGDATFFTVHANDEDVAIVGGSSRGLLLEARGGGELTENTPVDAPQLQGVSVTDTGSIWAVGFAGSIYTSDGGAFASVDPGVDFRAGESLHAVWVDGEGGVWAAGGDVLTPELDQGLLLRYGKR